MPKVKDNIVFLQEFLREFKATGSVWPTSRWAAKAMTTPLSDRKGNKEGLKILELGPGTGSVSKSIVKQMSVTDTLTECEINPFFMEQLKNNLKDDPYFEAHKPRITFHTCPMQDLPEDTVYDVIVCAIPFLNLDRGLVQEIFAKLKRLSHEKTEMTYYEYIGLRKVGLTFSPPKRRERIEALDTFFDSIFEKHLVNRSQVWRNVLPINVYRLKNLDDFSVAV